MNACQLPNASGTPQRGNDFGERLGARRVQPGVAPVDERRVGRDRQQQRQHRSQAVAHLHGAVGPAHADVDVHREGVVAPGDVLQPVDDAPVVLGVDVALLAVVGPRMGAGRAERDAARRRRARTAGGDGRAGRRARRRGPPRGPSGSRSPRRSARRRASPPARDRRRGRVAQLLEARDQVERRRVEDRELLLEADREVDRRLEGLAARSRSRLRRGGRTVRSGRSTARRADRPPGWRCGPSPPAGPAAAPRSS